MRDPVAQSTLPLPPPLADGGMPRVDEKVELDAMHREIARELETRRRIYPQWVRTGKLTQDVADHRIRILERVITLLQRIARHWEASGRHGGRGAG